MIRRNHTLMLASIQVLTADAATQKHIIDANAQAKAEAIVAAARAKAERETEMAYAKSYAYVRGACEGLSSLVWNGDFGVSIAKTERFIAKPFND